ncbi:hypothetical protein AVEN_65687-1 [Araneus ventricosus]|uniref:Ribosome biogenesis regulatory protein n=1 Tax=Araneus ventricosus TaxID=182803 RepID=A0A4Y2NP66_ARAVE|nr:hypothetical protein AVEN_65687-1 [Araneus ventricosus]
MQVVAHLPEPITVVPHEKSEWESKYGCHGINNEKVWVKEIPDNDVIVDPNEDYFRKEKEKKERIAKNEFQRLRNITFSSKMKAITIFECSRDHKHITGSLCR